MGLNMGGIGAYDELIYRLNSRTRGVPRQMRIIVVPLLSGLQIGRQSGERLARCLDGDIFAPASVCRTVLASMRRRSTHSGI